MAPIRWSPVENLHITLKFIGGWPKARLGELESALSAVRVAGQVPIRVSGFGFFPNPRHPHSFFAAVQAGPALAELATAIEHVLRPLGLEPEAREYHPHITLARTNGAGDLRGLRAHIAATPDSEFGTFDAAQFHLYLSQPGARGSVYPKLRTYDLMRETDDNR